MADEDVTPPGWQPESTSVAPQDARAPEERAQAERDEAIVAEVADRYSLVLSVEAEQRRREEEDLVFEGLDQWPVEEKKQRAGGRDAEGTLVPAKPTLEINLLDQPIQQLLSEARTARLGLTIKPKAGLANTKTSNYLKGLIRSIQVESGADAVRLWALERTAKAGRGHYKIETFFANDGDFDQDLRITRILDQNQIYWDPASIYADKLDAEWCIETVWIPEETRKRKWPTKPVTADASAFEESNNKWYATDSRTKQKNVLVALYWRVKHQERILAYHRPTKRLGWLDTWPPDLQAMAARREPSIQQRVVDLRSVERFIVDGHQLLEEGGWDGTYIPIIAVSGKEYLVRGERIWKGIVFAAKDVSRAINVMVSAIVELVGQMPRAPYIMYFGQDEGLEEMWDQAFTKAYTRLYIKPTLIGGQPAPPPQRQALEPQIQGLMFLVRMLQDMFSSIVGTVDAARRAVNPYDRSGVAIEALQRQGAAGTSNFLDNLATISMMYEGRVMVDAIPHVYDTPGRVVNIMGEDTDDETAIMIKRPFVRGPEGQPIPVPCAVCGAAGVEVLPWAIQSPNSFIPPLPVRRLCRACQGDRFATKETMPSTWMDQEVEYVDFAEGQYKVQVAVGRSYQTKQEEAMSAMNQLASAAPPLVPYYADLWVRAMGFSGSQEIADRIKKLSPYAGKDEKAQIPQEFIDQFQQLQAQHAETVTALEQAQQALATDAVKMAGQKELAAMKAAVDMSLERLRVQGRLMQEGAKIEGNQELEAIVGQIEQMRATAEQEHEVLLTLLEQRGAERLARVTAAAKATAGLLTSATAPAKPWPPEGWKGPGRSSGERQEKGS